MPTVVEIEYNPYLPETQIKINGNPPSVFSRLIQYTDEPIGVWIHEILDAVYREAGESFALRFIGTDSDAEAMHCACLQNQNCLGFEHRKFMVSDNLQRRMIRLNQLIRNTEMTDYMKTVVDVCFYVPSDYRDMIPTINGISIHNLFCSVCVQLTGLGEIPDDNQNTVLFIVAENEEKGQRYLERFHVNKPAYVLVMDGSKGIKRITQNGWFVSTDCSRFIGTITDCLLQEPLTLAFRTTVKSIHGGNRIRRELQRICSTDPILFISAEPTIEVGRSSRIEITSDIPGGQIPELVYQVRNESVASTDGMHIYGLKEGKTTFEVYKHGAGKPFFSQAITVIKRNRIRGFVLPEDSLLLGVKDCRTLEMNYYPTDADNVHEIRWKSSDESVVTVDRNGCLTAVGPGTCRVFCIAESVSAQCFCTVKPYMEDLVIDIDFNETIQMEPLEEIPVTYHTIPEDCYDAGLIMTSSDSSVVNIVNQTLYAKNRGTAQITIQNETGRITKKLEVIVSKKKKKGIFKRILS